MTETKTKIREVFVDISLLLLVSRSCACCSADSNTYCVLCDCVKLGI